ncbi:MAG: very short patch repair endonuclease [Candidatus Thiodiazotropha sp. (ex. Lucinisca nassula)]|nr:very short patch repair endonuclease [Candidatus Thiodiazotropha sp. (ex. Lucinisca nassula)]MBW9273869.1 very short patch repair endonuclease [Candidatus Thiodiazotropha sp. (ex. Lucinisca nassula)]
MTPKKLGIPKSSSEAASHRMRMTGQRDTSAEMRIRRLLHAMGFRYRVDYPVLERPRRRADLAFTRVRVAVFIDGCFWHGCPEHGTWPKANAKFWREKIETNIKRDFDTDKRLVEKGWKVIRVWEHEDPEEVSQMIAKVVR